jgi:hypothetical protein
MTASKTHRRQRGQATGSLILLLVLLLGFGGWNYYRNWQIEREQEGPRPYASYSTTDLESLRAAYTTELETMKQKLGAAKNQRGRVSRQQGTIADHVDQFSRTTRTSSAIRNAAGDLAERQARVQTLDEELAYRASLAEGMMLHLKRLTTL